MSDPRATDGTPRLDRFLKTIDAGADTTATNEDGETVWNLIQGEVVAYTG